MTPITGTYPFGSSLVPVVQEERSPRPIFVLGVYASAVHARWVACNGRVLVRALAVASEPAIFWDASDADTIVSRITVLAVKMKGTLDEVWTAQIAKGMKQQAVAVLRVELGRERRRGERRVLLPWVSAGSLRQLASVLRPRCSFGFAS